MLKKIFKKLKNEKGQALIELALTLPILLLIIGGIVDFGWIFTNQNIVDHLAREGARYAIVHPTDTNTVIANYTKSLAPQNVRSSLTVDVTYTNTTRRLGDVIIKVDGVVNIFTPITGLFTNGQSIKLTSSCRMKVE